MIGQISFKIRFTKKKLIDSFLLFFLVLSFWAIFSIGVAFIPLIPILLNNDLLMSLNSIYLNLSYSYIAGLLIYCLTVVIPNYNRKRVYIPLINTIISNYYFHSLLNFYLFYSERTDIVDICNHENVKRFFENELKSNKKLINEILKSEEKIIFLKRLKLDYQEFNISIIPNEAYLFDNQLSIINKIRQDAFMKRLELYMDFMGMIEFDKLFYLEFNSYILLVEELKNTSTY